MHRDFYLFLFRFMNGYLHLSWSMKSLGSISVYRMHLKIALWFIMLGFMATDGQCATVDEDPLAIFLSWKEDPTTSISIDWHSRQKKYLKLYYKEKGSSEWLEVPGKLQAFPYSDRVIHRVSLNDLKPGTAYEVKFSENANPYYFRTMPADTEGEAIRIAIGGDTMHSKKYMEETNRQVLKFDPHFVLIGGDLAYANGKAREVERWYDWFDAWNSSLVTQDRRLIPVVVGIGNHEVIRGYYGKHEDYKAKPENREKIAPYFYKLFAFPGHPGYNILDFGKYLSLIVLDTDHTNPIDGEQAEWLAEKLRERQDVQHLIPVYHVPAYPSVRSLKSRTSRRIRKHWLPLFEEWGVKVAFENHDHAYKRTYPIKNHEVDEEGIVFIGDGAWGTAPREVHDAEESWYLQKAESVRHFILMTIQGGELKMLMVDKDGQQIDSYPSTSGE